MNPQPTEPPSNSSSFRFLQKILSKKPETLVLVLDLETNGLSPRYSVLSVTAVKYRCQYTQWEKVGRFHRFYYSRESENPEALRVNGLTKDRIRREREGKGWPEFFDEDYEFVEFCQGIDLVVGHNINFDLKFLPFLKDVARFCTMKSHTTDKFPSLSKLAHRYGLSVDSGRLHEGAYDVELTACIFEKILQDLEGYIVLEKQQEKQKRKHKASVETSALEPSRALEIRSRLGL
ncbi:MAG: 3'-5' exonuclease [Spirochaetales bacterium]